MKNVDDIDDLFREGLAQDFPYDPNLWNQLESSLEGATIPSPPLSKGGDGFLGLSIVAVLAISFFSLMVPERIAVAASNEYLSAPIVLQTPFLALDGSTANGLLPETTKTIQEGEVATVITASIESTLGAADPNGRSNPGRTVIPQTLIQEEAIIDKSSQQANDSSNDAYASDYSNETITAEKVTEDRAAISTTHAIALPLEKAAGKQAATADISIENSAAINAVSQSYERRQLDYLAAKDLKLRSSSKHIAPISPEFEYSDYRQTRPFQIELVARRSFGLQKQLDIQDENWKDYKQTHESQQYQQSLGLNIRTNLSRVFVGSGIHWESHHESVSYPVVFEDILERTQEKYIHRLLGLTLNVDGEIVPLIDRDTITTITTDTVLSRRPVSARNITRRIVLPLYVGYELPIGRWSIEAQTGMSFGWLTESQGFYINQDLESLSVLKAGENIHHLSMSHDSQLRLGYLIDNWARLGVAAGYRYDLRSRAIDYDSRLSSYDLRLWVRFQPFR